MKRSGWWHPLALACAAAGGVAVGGCSEGPIDVASNPLLDGMVAHWTLDETAGLQAADSSGNRYHGNVTLGTAGRWTAGEFGGALHFEGGTTITVDHFLQGQPAWSVALWAKPTAANSLLRFATLLSTEIPASTVTDPHPGGGWQMNISSPSAPSAGQTDYEFAYWLGPDDGDYHIYDCNCLQPDVWMHIAAVVDAAGPMRTLTFYAGGNLQGLGHYDAVSRGYAVGPILMGTETLYFGRWQPPPTNSGEVRPFQGDLDDVVIYRRALSRDEVKLLSQVPAPSRRGS